MNFLKIKSVSVLIVVFLGMLFVSKPLLVDALSVSPVRLEIKGNPGQELNTEMTLTNDTENSQTFYSSFANFEAQGETGNPAFVESKDDLDKWMATSTSITLNPGESLIVPIKINIPIDAEAGGHFAAVFWGTSPNRPEASAVTIGAKIGMLILLSINGEVEEAGGLLEFSTIDGKFWYNTLPVSFRYRFKNDGGDRIKPMGIARIRNTVFIPVDKVNANISEGNVLPGSIRRFEFDWLRSPRAKNFIAPDGVIAQFFDTALYQFKNFAVGLYSARLNLSYGTQEINTSMTTYFFVFPWQMLICLIIVLLIVFWGGNKLLKRYNRYIIQKARLGIHLPNEANHG
ncbi:MAG: hypothetical protein WC603_02120 [Candidatus Paceibacterota bacterium]|jgi:hypothetical protein